MVKKTKYYFDSISEDFASWTNPFDLAGRLQWFDLQLGRFEVKNELVLDVGCGLGQFSDLVIKRGGCPVALDNARKLLNKTKQKIFMCANGDALNLPFADSLFSFVISSECIEHTENPGAAIKEMLRVLKPGGVIIFSTPNYAWRWSVGIAEKLKMRRFEGVENWLRCRQVKNILIKEKTEILVNRGLFLLPFQIKPLWPLINWFNRYGQIFRPFMINQCWVARKA